VSFTVTLTFDDDFEKAVDTGRWIAKTLDGIVDGFQPDMTRVAVEGATQTTGRFVVCGTRINGSETRCVQPHAHQGKHSPDWRRQ
jgi:hypothetical protein